MIDEIQREFDLLEKLEFELLEQLEIIKQRKAELLELLLREQE